MSNYKQIAAKYIKDNKIDNNYIATGIVLYYYLSIVKIKFMTDFTETKNHYKCMLVDKRIELLPKQTTDRITKEILILSKEV